ncbi:Probable RNA-directed DNA polymerase from transposon X-element [Eumeta japonica]|uniref:Probable RNA-directed DNA polymerase from transposon X-element n=1 Tax=Eumeta variegata TaxID=151549 RepID=A0A4C1Z0H5_EUMVA|nr:Probable RNA-directed DNA polymerase from transposon X-element [Eumeta japonica]
MHRWRTVWRISWILPLPPFQEIYLSPGPGQAGLYKIVIRLPKKKASGPDSISTAALRHLPRRAIVAMNRVFNGILCSAGKDPRKPENIRPITLLSNVAKAFERALLTKLRLFLTPRQE